MERRPTVIILTKIAIYCYFSCSITIPDYFPAEKKVIPILLLKILFVKELSYFTYNDFILPPSTGKLIPLIYAADGDARKAIA